MPVIVILIVVGIVTWLQGVIYEKLWDKKLKAKTVFTEHHMVAGQETEIVETLGNAKMLPLPWVEMKFEIMRNGKTDNIFRSDLFNILFHQQIVRKSKIKLDKRGVYQIDNLMLLSHDLIISKRLYRSYENHAKVTVYPRNLGKDAISVPYEKLMGTIATKRYTLEDPFLFKGIRSYQPEDSFKDINFKASARSGEWLVNTHEYTLDQKVRILLLVDKTSNFFYIDEFEAGLSYAAEMVSALERDGIPTAFKTNALDAIEKFEPDLKEGCSESHIEMVLETMARLELDQAGSKGTDILHELAEERQADEYYVIISVDHSPRMMEAYQNLKDYTDSCQFISPVSYRTFTAMTEEEQNLENTVDDFYFYRM